MVKLPVLPPMRCDDGCGKCCGPVPVTGRELESIRRYVDKHEVVSKNDDPLSCPFYDGTCSIYPVRPLICKVYGHTKKLECPQGYNVNSLPDIFVHNLIRQNGKAVGFLFQFFGNRAGVKTVPCNGGSSQAMPSGRRSSKKRRRR